MNVAVLTSGGVDSSVALCELATKTDYKLTAFYLKIWLEDELAYLGECPWEEDLKIVRKITDQYGIELRVISLQQEYRQKVVEYTLSELKRGGTPSPDLLCNQFIKFGAFFDKISSDPSETFDFVATGHYAGVEKRDGHQVLAKAKDAKKDQTYFLSRLSKEQINKLMFPLAQYQKQEVRELAQHYDLLNASRPDSQGICFLGKLKFNDFVSAYLGKKPGKIVDADTKKILGGHEGFWFHTMGQRKGLKLSGGPWYVVAKDVEQNIVYVRNEKFVEEIKSNIFSVRDLNWYGSPIEDKLECQVKIRHGEASTQAIIEQDKEGLWSVEMQKPDGGIADGQFAVFYKEQMCLGSGVIQKNSLKNLDL